MTGTAKLNRGEATRQKILDAAETLFADLSFDVARLEDVAQEVGIRRASIVYYFKSKQELYDAVEADIFAELLQSSRARLATGTSAWERVQLIIDSWLDFMVARPTAARLILRNCADLTPRSLNPMEFSETTLAQLETAIKDGHASGEFSAVDPVMLLHILGAGVLHYVCLGQLLGAERSYDPAEPQRLATFRGLLHQTLSALLRPSAG